MVGLFQPYNSSYNIIVYKRVIKKEPYFSFCKTIIRKNIILPNILCFIFDLCDENDSLKEEL